LVGPAGEGGGTETRTAGTMGGFRWARKVAVTRRQPDWVRGLLFFMIFSLNSEWPCKYCAPDLSMRVDKNPNLQRTQVEEGWKGWELQAGERILPPQKIGPRWIKRNVAGVVQKPIKRDLACGPVRDGRRGTAE